MNKKELSEETGRKPTDVDQVLENLTEEQRGVILESIYAVEHSSYRGPLPSPTDFAAYEEVLPGAPERILVMAEKSLDNRIELEKSIVNNNLSQAARGQILGFVLAVFFGCIALILGLQGHDTLAGIIGGADVVSLATIFVLSKRPQKDSSES